MNRRCAVVEYHFFCILHDVVAAGLRDSRVTILLFKDNYFEFERRYASRAKIS